MLMNKRIFVYSIAIPTLIALTLGLMQSSSFIAYAQTAETTTTIERLSSSSSPPDPFRHGRIDSAPSPTRFPSQARDLSQRASSHQGCTIVHEWSARSHRNLRPRDRSDRCCRERAYRLPRRHRLRAHENSWNPAYGRACGERPW